MRTIERTSSFKRDFKRIRTTPRHRDIAALLPEVLELLATDSPLPDRYRDHALSGNWKDHRDCHLKPDLVLIYRQPAIDVLQLVRLGSHSQLGL
jgi:mRNA interferase YafQ